MTDCHESTDLLPLSVEPSWKIFGLKG